jgi:hypothetical protein
MANENKPAAQAAATTAAPPDPAKPEGAKPIEMLPVYASNIQVQGTGNDFTLLFRRARPATSVKALAEGGQPDMAILELVSAVTLSPGAAKDLSILLRGLVEAHEKEYGAVSTPFTKKQAVAAKKQ